MSNEERTIDIGFHDDILMGIKLDLDKRKAIISIQTQNWFPVKNRSLIEKLKKGLRLKEDTQFFHSSNGKIVKIICTITKIPKIEFDNMQCSLEIIDAYVYKKELIIHSCDGSTIQLGIEDYKIKGAKIYEDS